MNYMNQMNTEEMTITPNMAEKLLKVNDINRPVNRANLQYWTRELLSGKYEPTHQGIAVSGTLDDPRTLIDGQHRLMAIIETGIPARFNISTNVPISAFANTDGGKPRSMGERTKIDSKSLQVLMFFSANRHVKKFKPSPNDITEMGEIVLPYLNFKGATRGVRSLTTAPIRSAFTVMNMIGELTNEYIGFVNGDFDNMTNSLCALYRRQMINPIRGGSVDARKLFCATIKCLESPDINKIHIPADYYSKTTQIINDALYFVSTTKTKGTK